MVAEPQPLSTPLRHLARCTLVALAFLRFFSPPCALPVVVVAARVPADITQWNRIPAWRNASAFALAGSATAAPDSNLGRWWDLQDLEPAFRNLGSLARTSQLLAKLDAGRPIVVAMLGSSFVHDFAGCFDTGPSSFSNLGIIPPPNTYPQAGQDWHATFASMGSDNKCRGGGYMEAFMHTINTTWPHPGHLFINAGKGGAGLNDAAETSCLSTYVPDDKLDLLLLDPTTAGTTPDNMEKMLRRYLRAKSQPVVLILSNTRNCQHLETLVPLPDPGMTCAADCLLLLNRTACESLGPEPYPAAASQVLEEERTALDALAVHYQVAHLDLHRLLVGMLAGDLPGDNSRPLGRLKVTSKWQLVNRLFTDTVHFQKCVGLSWDRTIVRDPASFDPCVSDRDGALLVSDLLVYWLVKIQDLIDKVAASPPLAAATYELPAPMHLRFDQVYLMRCFGFSFEQILSSPAHKHPASGHLAAADAHGGGGGEGGTSGTDPAADGVDSSPSAGAQEKVAAVHEQLVRVVPGDFFSIRGSADRTSFQPLPPLNVTRVHGWIFQRFYISSKGEAKFKPGYVSRVPGSELEFTVNSTFATMNFSSLPEVMITYTESFDGWGKARITCPEAEGGGCQCEPVLVDAATGEKYSLLRSVAVPVTQHPHCLLRVTVVDEPGRGHKFKLSQVTVRYLSQVGVNVGRRRSISKK